MQDFRQGFINLTMRAFLDDESKQYVSYCDELGVSSCGDSLEEAFTNAAQATHLYLNSIEQVRERERIFKQHHIKIQSGEK